MKKSQLSLIITFILCAGIGLNAFSQTKSKAKNNTEKIHINKKGEIHDHGWNKIGFIGKDDIVRDNKGKTIYFIDKNGNVIDAIGKNLGKAQKNGNYYNLAGENVITVKDKDAEKCEILDSKGHNMGTTHKNYKLHACAAHCMALTQKNAKEKAKTN